MLSIPTTLGQGPACPSGFPAALSRTRAVHRTRTCSVVHAFWGMWTGHCSCTRHSSTRSCSLQRGSSLQGWHSRRRGTRLHVHVTSFASNLERGGGSKPTLQYSTRMQWRCGCALHLNLGMTCSSKQPELPRLAGGNSGGVTAAARPRA